MIDPLGVNAWKYNKDEDLVIFNDQDYLIFQKQNGEIRILERIEYSVTNRQPMFLEEVLIRELVAYKKAEESFEKADEEFLD